MLAIALFLTAALPYPLQGGTAHADGPKIELKTELGYKGNIKQDKWNPLKLVLTSDRDISGDIVVRIQNTNGMGQDAAYVQHVELPKDTAKEITIGVPGYFFNKDNNEITFYEGSYKNGKPLPFASGKKYVQKTPTMGALIGVLSDDQDTMNFLSVLNGKGGSVLTVPLKAEDISGDAMLLDGLDVLVINNFASDTLSKAQQDAIKTWVKSGGTLVLSGGVGYAKTAAPFADIAPVQSNGTLEVTQLPELQKLGGKPLKLDGSFTISTAVPIKEAVVDTTAAEMPLFASRSLEQGKVWYAAYDVSMEPVSSWAGHANAWASILRNEMPKNGNVYYGSIMDNLSYVLDYFPSLKMPSFQVLLWMLLAYAVIVAPLLYFILKKADKREWAWFLIPLLAVVASGTVYVVGSADKTEEMAHTINLIEMDGEGKGVKSTASALFTPRSGNYELEFAKGTYLKTQRMNGGFGGAAENKSFIRTEEDQTKLELRDMPQWSLAKFWADNPTPEETGRLAVEVEVDSNGQLTGSVANETLNDLKEVVLVVGGRAYKLGEIPRKGSVKISNNKNSVVQIMGGDLAGLIYPYSQQDQFNRQRDILSNYSYRSGTMMNSAYVFGWSEDDLTNYTLKGKAIHSDQLNFWTQKVQIEWGKNGKINIPYGFINPEVTQMNSPNFSVYPHGIELGQGSVIAEFLLTSANEVEYSEFSIKGTKLGGDMTMEIWNAEKNDWEKVEGKNGVFTVTDNLKRYIVDNRIRFSITSKTQGMFKMPELSLKGEVK